MQYFAIKKVFKVLKEIFFFFIFINFAQLAITL